MVREDAIFSKLQIYENIREGLSFSAILKTDFYNNVTACNFAKRIAASQFSGYFQKVYSNPIKHLRWSLLQK